MYKYTTGNIIQADVDALVNTVNTVGIMGKGIALVFKKAFPLNYKLYKEACDRGSFQLGELFITDTGQLRPKLIINFPTKQHWKSKSKIEFIKLGLKKLAQAIVDRHIKSIAIPPLGCGNGGLLWKDVKPLIEQELESVSNNTEIIIYEPGYNNQTTSSLQNISLTPARAMLLCALENYQLLGYSINLLVAQKTAYFLQELGEPLNLDYEKGYYGPYSHKLQHLLKYLNGSFLQFKHEETKPGTTVNIKNFQQVEQYSEAHLDKSQKERLERFQHLIEGFESPYGLELLATVDFLKKQMPINTTEELVNEIKNWTKRKKEIMKPFHIQVANDRLNEYQQQRWL